MERDAPLNQKDEAYEVKLRPEGLNEFVGHDAIKERLSVILRASKEREEPLGHVLFNGPPGLGKTTLSNIIAHEMGSHLHITSGPAIDKAGDLAGILTNLAEGDILFIDEIHRLNRAIEEYLYPAIEDFKLDLMLDSGPSARSVQVKLNKFTLVGATTKAGALSSPLRSRFQSHFRLNFYDPKTLAVIVKRSARLLKVALDEDAAFAIAQRSRGTPRITNHLLRWVRDFAQIQKKSRIDHATALCALEMLEIDEYGLDEMDKRILQTIIEQHSGGPVGISTIAAALGEESSTISDVYEPFLMMQGFLKRTPRGRETTQLAKAHLFGD